MSKGVLLFASNNGKIDYVKQAYFLAQRISKYMSLPTSIVCNHDISQKYAKAFDNVIKVDSVGSFRNKKYNDGTLWGMSLPFNNMSRADAYELSPYEETLVMDTDYIISNDILNNCFVQQKDLLLYKHSVHLGEFDATHEFERISDTSVDFYWATVVFFRKSEQNKIFFDLVKHIKENYLHYRNVYQFRSTVYRNDFAFSIAVHIMNGYTSGEFAGEMPGTKFYTIDRDILLEIQNDEFLCLVENTRSLGDYYTVKLKGENLHIMNKFSLERAIDNQ